ncbi:5'-3' exonuclease H3TH domain-containing protein [Parvibaculum sp.]|uniref:5'-3' exonuclease n=1 Tax=Parvibaculum sp. TaxID=2024848 RepID=UPI001D2910AB|nr:5'-3' exonuclease H3TH domain-containing protein [Parvibaculum sp.]MBX3490861.1 hypothetical protein [Parvibaculum sp.]
MNTLLLVDGSAFIHRAYHALPKMTRKSDGQPTGAVYGFCNLLMKFLDGSRPEISPTHCAVVFDPPGRNFRHKIDPNYKANRGPRPSDLTSQMDLMREATAALGVHGVEVQGFEADDLIATYARLAADAGMDVIIATGDKDMMQLVNGHVAIFDPFASKFVRRDEVILKFGVPPEKVVDVQALAGDSTDNVPGVPGIGIKTAARLIEEYGDLETLLASAGEIRQRKCRESLVGFAEQARKAKLLVSLDANVPAAVEIDAMTVPQPGREDFVRFCTLMEFSDLFRDEGPSDTAIGRDGDTPTDLNEAFTWWRDALAGLKPPIHSEPHCGFFQRRMVRGGVWVPVAIWLEQDIDADTGELLSDERLVCAVGGKEADADAEWTHCAGNPITEEEYRYLVARAEWARDFAPNEPAAQPYRKIDPLGIEPVF